MADRPKRAGDPLRPSSGPESPEPPCRHEGTETSVHENGRHLYVCQQCGRRRAAK